MVLVLLCIALTNLGLGYYLGTMLLGPLRTQGPVLAMTAILEQAIEPSASGDVAPGNTLQSELPESPVAITPRANRPVSGPAKAGWDSPSLDIRHDIANLRERTRYAATANDKQLAKSVATELRSRTQLWQKHLQELLDANLAQLDHDPAAKVDCVTPELCLAQIETLQTNIKMIDWSDSTEAIFKKLEREIEAVKHLLPANC